MNDKEKDKKPSEEEPKNTEGKKEEPSEGIKDIDADSIIDAFLEENPDLVDVPVEEWPEDAIEMLRETFNSENIDAPNSALPEEEDEEGEPINEPPPSTEEEEGEPDPDQDFDILELSKLVEAGDKEGAWDMLQSMFGVSAPAKMEPDQTNALDRLDSNKSNEGGGNALAKLFGANGLKYLG
jgi:hypothetical protein